MKKRNALIAGLAVLAIGCSGAALAGCSGYKFETYSYEQGGTSEKDWRALEYPDTTIQMDGIVKTEEYGESNLSFSDVNGVNMKVYAHMGQEGVFFGFVSDDTLVNYNPKNDVFNNTSVEIQVAPGGVETLNSNVVQLRLGANGTPDQWIGFPADDGNYAYTKKYIPSMGVVHIDGELNKSANGYSVELYLPYSSIGLSEKPESVVCAPSFNTMPDPLSSTRATWTMMLGCDLGQPATWYVVDDTGMTAHTAGFAKSAAGDLSQTKGYNEFYYFDSAPHEAYCLETIVDVKKSTAFLNGDNFPKFGLVNKSEGALQMFYIDAANREGTNFGTVHAVQSTAGGTNWQWDNNASTSIEGHWGNSYINRYSNKKLETIFYENDLYFILDGTLVKSVKNFTEGSVGAIPGVVCFNTRAKFSGNKFTTDPAEVKAELDKYLAKERTIDGDLSDWTNEDVNRHAQTAADSTNGNKMTVRAFRGSDGLYIAYEVDHKVNLTPKKWDEGWWKNTNIEFFVGGVEEKNHYALTQFGDGGYMDGVMLTTRNPDRTYSTVGEIFVPFASLTRDGFDTNETLNVGFAFKSTNGTADSLLNGEEWWAFEGTPTSVQFPIGEKGIGYEYTLSYAAGEGATGTAPASEKMMQGDTVALKANPFTKEGYTFAGWTDGTYAYAAGEQFTMPKGNVTFTPYWAKSGAAANLSVTYAAGAEGVQGTLPSDTNTYAAGGIVTVQSGEVTREGYRFMGWSNGSKTYAAGEKLFMGESGLTLTAVWAQVFTVKYEAEEYEGELPEQALYAAGEILTVPSTLLEKEGFDFVGWTDGINLYEAGARIEVNGDMTLTAVFRNKVKVDGKLDDWKALSSKTVGAHSIKAGDNRGAIWYGVLRDDGLYLATEIYHDKIKYGQNDWWTNLNFEFHIGAKNTQYYVFLKNANEGNFTVGTSEGVTAAAYTQESGEAMGTKYHSIVEAFLPNATISGLKETDGSIRVGVAIKTCDNDEKITGGALQYAEGDGDAWYAPYGSLPYDYDKFTFVTRDGMYLRNEYLYPDMEFGIDSAAEDTGITVDGDLTDWATATNKTLKIEGTDQYEGKNVTFYGKMTKAGLYLAVQANHEKFVTGQRNWYENTNVEFRIGEVLGNTRNTRSKQYFAYAVSATQFKGSDDSMQIACVSTQNNDESYTTAVEIFIPAETLVKYDYMVQDGMIHVGVAWKTPGDRINNNNRDGKDADGNEGGQETDEWWRPKGVNIQYDPACVTGDGIYTASEYKNLKA